MRVKGSKRPFTLFEILIVMTLIATALGVLTLQISKAIKGERFERGVDQVIVKLALAQELMLDFHTDVVVNLTFNQETKNLVCTLDIARPLPPNLEKSINRYQTIKGIEEIATQEGLRNSITLCFDATLGTIPQTDLSLLAHNKKAVLILDGYPAQIKRGIFHGQTKNCQATYPKESLSST